MDEKLIKNFTEKAKALSAEVFRYKDLNSAYDKIAEVIKKEGVKEVGCVARGLVKNLPARLQKENIKIVYEGPPQEIAKLQIGITQVQAGIAETGTIAQKATDLYARYFSMLPSTNIVLLETSKVKATLSEAMEEVKENGGLPGYTAFISGPSRTADIERVLTIGVHGPGRLVILLVDEGGESNGSK
ncbi:MAG: L-lactate dehydrogenase complex protein LldG [Clostridia bacterium]|nr:L-lactate dehydrogenase complex protein LldG [Clostridia bacterium]